MKLQKFIVCIKNISPDCKNEGSLDLISKQNRIDHKTTTKFINLPKYIYIFGHNNNYDEKTRVITQSKLFLVLVKLTQTRNNDRVRD